VDTPAGAPQDTEDRILEAAHRVFLRRGVDAARTREIADEAGVNNALLHYYFRTKERLAETVFTRAAGVLFPRLAEALSSDGTIEERVRRFVAVELDFFEANPYLPGYVLGEMRAHRERMQALVRAVLPVDRLRGVILDGLQAQLDAEAAAGRLRPTRADDFVVNLVSLLVFPFVATPMLEVVLGLDGPAFAALIERRRTDLAEYVLRALRADAPPAP
jgi:AcrR family transcriptional regulator